MISQFAKHFPIFKGVKVHQIALPDKQKVWIKNLDQLIHKIKKFRHDGIQKVDIVTDFDYTLTKHKHQGRKCHSLFGLWGQSNHLPFDFKESLIKNYQRYGPYQTDQQISFKQKKRLIDQFYRIQKRLFSEYSFSDSTIQKVMNQSNIVFRYGAQYLFEKSSQLNIPIHIISGGISDILFNTIYSIAKDKCLQNIYVYSNRFQFKNNYISDFHPETIHSYNKYKIIPDKVKKTRKNCILMGDLVSDIYMTHQANYENQISIFYAKEDSCNQRKLAQRKFDIIVECDQTLRFVMFLIDYIQYQQIDRQYLRNCHDRFHNKLNKEDFY